MKKATPLIIALAIIAMTPSLAQTEKGTFLLGGSFFTGLTGTGGDMDNFNFNLRPSMGIFVVDDLAIGVSLPLNFTTSNNTTSISYGFTPSIRYYLAHVNKIGFFANGSLGYSGSRIKYNGDVNTNDGIVGGIGGGATFFINDNIGLDGNIGYSFSDYDSYKSKNFGLSIGFQIFL